MKALSSPEEIFNLLNKNVIDQQVALEQISVSLYKHLNRIKVGNIMLIGNSGTGKTTIMKSIELLFAKDPRFAKFMNVVRMNANLVADENRKPDASIILERLVAGAQKILGSQPNPERFKDLVEHGVVFLDEVDKIRARVGDITNAKGILAQESLLTFIEGERINIPYAQRQEDGSLTRIQIPVDTSGVLFIAGGAYEGLYDAVYRRVAEGEHRDKLVREFVVEEHNRDLSEKEHFSLQSYLRYEDMFEYGMSPQFLGRFDEIIVLNDLSVHALMRIFVEPTDSLFREAKRYFSSFGVEFTITKEGLLRLAELAHENHRLGARSLRSVFKRIMRGLEFNPLENPMVDAHQGKKTLTLTADMVSNLG